MTEYGPLDPESVVAFMKIKYAVVVLGAIVTVLFAPKAPVNLITRNIPS